MTRTLAPVLIALIVVISTLAVATTPAAAAHGETGDQHEYTKKGYEIGIEIGELYLTVALVGVGQVGAVVYARTTASVGRANALDRIGESGSADVGRTRSQHRSFGGQILNVASTVTPVLVGAVGATIGFAIDTVRHFQHRPGEFYE